MKVLQSLYNMIIKIWLLSIPLLIILTVYYNNFRFNHILYYLYFSITLLVIEIVIAKFIPYSKDNDSILFVTMVFTAIALFISGLIYGTLILPKSYKIDFLKKIHRNKTEKIILYDFDVYGKECSHKGFHFCKKIKLLNNKEILDVKMDKILKVLDDTIEVSNSKGVGIHKNKFLLEFINIDKKSVWVFIGNEKNNEFYIETDIKVDTKNWHFYRNINYGEFYVSKLKSILNVSDLEEWRKKNRK